MFSGYAILKFALYLKLLTLQVLYCNKITYYTINYTARCFARVRLQKVSKFHDHKVFLRLCTNRIGQLITIKIHKHILFQQLTLHSTFLHFKIYKEISQQLYV